MSKYKDYLMDWENKIHEIEGYEEKISESECIEETVECDVLYPIYVCTS